MSDQLPSSHRKSGFATDLFIPVMLLATTMIVLLIWQIVITSNSKTQLENAITRQEPAVNQSNKVQAGVSKLLTDLLAAAQTDAGAQAIVTKYKIQQTGTASAPATP